ncbi:MAG TPA: hypothetical protein VF753_08470 [Terriglobales bacterium]
MPSQPPSKESKTEAPAAGGPLRLGNFLCFLMPSVADLLFAVLLFGLSAGALGRLLLRDADTGWHIRNGQRILLTHAIPRVDSFSATMSGKPWYAWEWLWDLGMAVIHQVMGLNGVVFYSAAIIAATFALALYLATDRGANLLVTLFLLVLALGASAVHFLARPHVVSWLLTVIWFQLLDSSLMARDCIDRKRLYWLPLIMLLWANLHGGFLIGFALLGAYASGFFIEYFSRPEQQTRAAQILRQIGLPTLLCILASLVNPYGYRLHVHVWKYLSDRFLMNSISEFHSPNFHGAAQECFALLILITIVAVASAHKKAHPAHVLVLLFAIYSGLFATRNLPVSSLLIVLILAPLLSETISGVVEGKSAEWMKSTCARLNGFGSRMQSIDLRLSGHLWLVAAFVVGLWACAHSGRVGSEQVINAYFDPKKFPVEAVDALAQRQRTENKIFEPIYSLDSWGGYLIYRQYPAQKVFIDDRHDFYGDAYIKDYIKVTLAQPGWDEVLNDLHANLVLIPAGSSLASVMRLSPDWKTTHEDQAAILFQRID